MAKRINVLAKYRLGKVVVELKELQKDSKFNKIDEWDLSQATDMIEKILEGKKTQDAPD
jgi:hypothetical protein